MRLLTQFDPIEVGEEDDFGFDLTAEAGTAFMILTEWKCRLSPYSAGFDPDPQSRVLNARPLTVIYGPGGIRSKTGQFSYARIGTMPASAAGATYVLQAIAYLSDGRKIARNATVPCVLPGQ